ncbi:MAG: RidA family protein [Alphaproteobacteria bacterium]|nr:RidA family protein [Alphaproteobacteria bacterium]
MPLPIYHLVAGLPKPVSPSSHAVESEGWVFLTGSFPRDLANPDAPFPAGIAAQTERTLGNMARTLAGLGLTFRNLVSVRVFLTSFTRDYADMNQVYARLLGDAQPARTCVGVTDLVRGALIEIDGIARRP